MASKIPMFKIILHPDIDKVLKNGKKPIVVRATFLRRRRYFSIGVNTDVQKWNSELSLIHGNGKRLTEEEKESNSLLHKLSVKLKENEFYFSENEFTFKKFEERFFGIQSKLNFVQFTKDFIQDLTRQGRIGSVLTYSHTLRRFVKFTKGKTMNFADVNEEFIRAFELFLKENGNKVNTIGLHMRNLRSIYNQAIKKKTAKSENYPFKHYQIKTQATMKRALSDDEISRLIKFQAEAKGRVKDSVNYFLFGYFSFGINVHDMARLEVSNLEGNLIRYRRGKTGALIRVPINDQLAKIILEYEGNNPPFIFPVLEVGLSPTTERHRIHAWRKRINEDLRSIGETLNLPKGLTYYWCRHSMASRLQRKNVATPMISQTLGHQSEKTTKVYLAGFGDETISEIQKLL